MIFAMHEISEFIRKVYIPLLSLLKAWESFQNDLARVLFTSTSAATKHTAMEFHTGWLMGIILQFFIPILKTWMTQESSSDILDANKFNTIIPVTLSLRFYIHEIHNVLLCLNHFVFWMSSYVIYSKYHTIYIPCFKKHLEVCNLHFVLWR